MRVEIDERMRAALARLTENEKICLRRRLLPQTAKEMAIELGVSPHAVEKRLKMARTKLGLSSSLQAARMLAAAEGYGRAVPQEADLAGGGEPEQTGSGVAGNRRRMVLISGVALMSLILAALFAFMPAAQESEAPSPAPGMRKASLADVGAFLTEGFAFHDKDKSGYLEGAEIGALEPRTAAHRDRALPPAPPAGARDPAGEAKWMRKLDNDRDGRVSRQEYIEYMTPWILLSGVPKDWTPKR